MIPQAPNVLNRIIETFGKPYVIPYWKIGERGIGMTVLQDGIWGRLPDGRLIVGIGLKHLRVVASDG